MGLAGLNMSQQQFDRAPCANTKQLNGSMINCDDRANLVCSKCRLVQVFQLLALQVLII